VRAMCQMWRRSSGGREGKSWKSVAMMKMKMKQGV
jgi:hypothetical protein